jgi:hypothetical protein
MTSPETERRCEAMILTYFPPYRCTSIATAERYGRHVCPVHSQARRVRYFDDDDGVLHG